MLKLLDSITIHCLPIKGTYLPSEMDLTLSLWHRMTTNNKVGRLAPLCPNGAKKTQNALCVRFAPTTLFSFCSHKFLRGSSLRKIILFGLSFLGWVHNFSHTLNWIVVGPTYNKPPPVDDESIPRRSSTAVTSNSKSARFLTTTNCRKGDGQVLCLPHSYFFLYWWGSHQCHSQQWDDGARQPSAEMHQLQ